MGREVVYSVCGMCSVRCPIAVDVEEGRVADAAFQAKGCTASIAAGAALAEWTIGKTLAEIGAGGKSIGQEVGVRTQVDVLNAQQQLYSARRDLAQAKYNYIMSTLKLKASVGRLTEADVVAVNAWLERKP